MRLRTYVDLAPDDGARRMSVSARLDLVLDDGRRIVLLDGRGWCSEVRAAGGPPPPIDPWVHETVEDIEHMARDVVGPDEPGDSHWEALARIARDQGVEVDDLAALPHDVELSQAVRERLDRAQRPQTGQGEAPSRA